MEQKIGEGTQIFQKEGQAWSRGGCLKRGVAGTGGLTRSLFLEGMTLFQGELQFFLKNKLKSEIFNNKKVYLQNVFLGHN